MKQNPYAMLRRKEHAQSHSDREKDLEGYAELGLVEKGRKQKDLTKTVTEELSEDEDFLNKVFKKK